MPIEIRKAVQTDIDDLVKLLKLLFSIEADFDFDAGKQKRGLATLLQTPGACVWVAMYEGHVVGMCTVQTLVSTAEGGCVGLVEDVVVEDAFRGRGVGKLLLSHMEAWCQQQGMTRLQLLVDKNNHPALEFYKRQQWSSTDLICLRKKLLQQT